MKRIILIALLFSFGAAAAQTPPPATGRELPRGELIVYADETEAAAAGRAASKWHTPLEDWTRTDTERGALFSTRFTVPFAWANRAVLLHVASASDGYEVRVNGRRAAGVTDANGPAEFAITPLTHEGVNTLEIEVAADAGMRRIESWKSGTAPALGACYVTSPPMIRIRDVVAATRRSGGTNLAEVAVAVRTHALNGKTARIHYRLTDGAGGVAAQGYRDLTLAMRGEDTVRFLAEIPDSMLWSAAHPVRYDLSLKTQTEGRYTEYLHLKCGFRTLAFRDGAVEVGGEPVVLRETAADPGIGAGEIARLREAGYNTLRMRPGVVSHRLYDLCDSLGMYVIAQAPVDSSHAGASIARGGNPSNDPAWREEYGARAANAYHTAKGHPSVIAFSIAAGSANGICLYETYLDMKRLERERPVLYPDAAGEWNTDQLRTTDEPAPRVAEVTGF